MLTGRGADFIIIDDPLKPEDAVSDIGRNAVNNWFDSTLLSRLNDKTKGCIIIIMQRLHQDDLVGHVLEQDDWEVVTFPAIAETDEEYRIGNVFGSRTVKRHEGEPLHQERESLLMLRETQKRIGDYHFSSQYQQNPIPLGGAVVKDHWLMYYDVTAQELFYPLILQSWDTANKSGDLHDYSVCTTWGVKDKHYYLLHVFRKRLNYPELKRAVTELAGQFKPHTILIEDKASGTQLIQDLKADGMSRVVPYQPPSGTDKLMHLYAQTALFENGQVFLPEQAPWLDDYRRELLSFPGSKYDDQVDSTTQALDHLKNKNSKLEIWAKLGRD